MQKKRLAVIDCGTNTFNLLIAESAGKGFRFLHRTKRVVKLGQGGIGAGILSEAGIQRALVALQSYRTLVEEYGATKVVIVGTAAIRDAVNRAAFLRKVRRETGFRIQLIDGLREAELIWKGVQLACPELTSNYLIMDIGGGSVEFIITDTQRILWKKSYRLGAARLLETFTPSDPITKKELSLIHEHLETRLADLFSAIEQFKPVSLVGSSGSFDTFAGLILRAKHERGLKRGQSHYAFRLSEYTALHRQLVRSTYTERLHMPGMLRMRADMIVLASLLLTFVLKNSGIRQLHLSTFSLKEGLLSEHL